MSDTNTTIYAVIRRTRARTEWMGFYHSREDAEWWTNHLNSDLPARAIRYEVTETVVKGAGTHVKVTVKDWLIRATQQEG